MDHKRKKIARMLAARRQYDLKQRIQGNTREHEPEKESAPVDVEEEGRQRSSFGQRFLSQILVAGCLFFALGIVYERDDAPFQAVQAFVDQSFEQNFQFVAVADWYENQFGGPLKLLPDQRAGESEEMYNYAIPASGIIGESSAEDGKGILLETDAQAVVKAVKGGHVVSLSNEKEDEFGKVIEVQHSDGTTSIYGMLDQVSVSLYDMIPAGTALGKVMPMDGEETGQFYFALRQGEKYIDPSDVMSFE